MQLTAKERQVLKHITQFPGCSKKRISMVVQNSKSALRYLSRVRYVYVIKLMPYAGALDSFYYTKSAYEAIMNKSKNRFDSFIQNLK